MRFSVSVATALLLCFPGSLAAEPIVITTGSIEFFRFEQPVLFAWAGQRFSTNIFPYGDDRFGGPPGNCRSCAVGEVFDPGGAVLFDLVENGTFTLDGEAYRILGGRGIYSAGSLRVPPGQPEEITFSSSIFQYTGFFEGENGQGEITRVDLIGSGTVGFSFTNEDSGPVYLAASYTFSDAAPVPEPASVFLLGLGVTGYLIRTRVRSFAPSLDVRRRCPPGGRPPSPAK